MLFFFKWIERRKLLQSLFMCAAVRLNLREEVGSDRTATQNSKVNKNRLYVPQFGFFVFVFVSQHQVKKCVFRDSLKRSSGLFAVKTQTLSFFLPIKGPESVPPPSPPPRCCVFAWR